MDKITCKHCGTKYPADVSKCPLCGASNAPSVGDEFDFLDDDFEAKPAEAPAEPAAPVAPVVTPAAEEPEAPAAAEAETPADSILKDPAFTSGVPSSGNTARYNWEEIIAEINKQKEQI